jgi:glucokinase
LTLVGLDIGGTNLKAVCVTAEGEIVGETTMRAGGLLPRDELLARLAEAVEIVAKGTMPRFCGVAVGGKIQPDGIMYVGSTNLPNLAGVPLLETLANAIGLPCRVDNDARATMRGEAWTGAALGLRNALTVTLGTGIGGGLLLDGKIHAGSHGGAGEIGVWRLGPEPETVENIASPGRVLERHEHGLAGLLALKDADEAMARDAAVVFDLIGRAIANAHLLLDLDAVILSGGVISIGEPFRQAVESAFVRSCPEAFHHDLSIKLGTLGAYAGAVGAAALWKDDIAA